MFTKLSKQTETVKPQSFAEQLTEATKLFTDAINKLKGISSGVSKKMEENDAKMKELTLENTAFLCVRFSETYPLTFLLSSLRLLL